MCLSRTTLNKTPSTNISTWTEKYENGVTYGVGSPLRSVHSTDSTYGVWCHPVYDQRMGSWWHGGGYDMGFANPKAV